MAYVAMVTIRFDGRFFVIETVKETAEGKTESNLTDFLGVVRRAFGWHLRAGLTSPFPNCSQPPTLL